jgi:ABC-type thiamine transport system substrate-binding protein
LNRNGKLEGKSGKALAEMSNPQADVIWMVNNFALEKLKESGAIQPYAPKAVSYPTHLKIRMVSGSGIYMDVWRRHLFC